MRPEEAFRLRLEQYQDGALTIHHGKTANSRRRIPLSPRAVAVLEMRRTVSSGSPWIFPAETRSGHIEPGSLKRQHRQACEASGVEFFPLYTMRHTCLTRWAPHMDPWTLHKLAGHQDMSITKRYVHPSGETIQRALDKARHARGGHAYGHTGEERTADTAGTSTVIQ